jgi:hypothetical protein
LLPVTNVRYESARQNRAMILPVVASPGPIAVKTFCLAASLAMLTLASAHAADVYK